MAQKKNIENKGTFIFVVVLCWQGRFCRKEEALLSLVWQYYKKEFG
jgi:hypothetical protein